MPKLACRSCGRQIYTVAPFDALFAEERRCPRCGSRLHAERRVLDRRGAQRRLSSAAEPGPPVEAGERRTTPDRRFGRRRAGDAGAWSRS